MAQPHQYQLALPAQIATKSDLVGVLRNVESVLDAYIENGVRKFEGVDFVSRPDVSSNLATLVRENNLEVTVEVLKSLKNWLQHLLDHAPIVRFVFASDPNPEFLGRIVHWMRSESGQFVIIRYSIQPNIAAGCLLYTPARRYDFSLRQHLLDRADVFTKQLTNVISKTMQPADAPTPQGAQ